MYRKGKLKVDTMYTEPNHSIYEYNIVEMTVGSAKLVGYSNVDVDPQRIIFVHGMDLASCWL